MSKLDFKYGNKKVVFEYKIEDVFNGEEQDFQIGANIELKVNIENGRTGLGIIQFVNPIIEVGDFGDRRTDDNWAVDKKIYQDQTHENRIPLYGLSGDGVARKITYDCSLKNKETAEIGQVAAIRDIPREIFRFDGEARKTSFVDVVAYIKDDSIEILPVMFKWGYGVNAEGEFSLTAPQLQANVSNKMRDALLKYYRVSGIQDDDINVTWLH